MSDEIYNLRRGHGPLIVSMPHSGEELGPFAPRMTEAARQIADTDWHMPALYDFLSDMDVTVLSARYSRYVIDLNRDPSGKSLYPGQSVTELCPTSTFDNEPLYAPGETPDDAEISARTATYWQPYHDALQAEIARVKAAHGYALLWDAHSIRSVVPRFFEGRLPDFNLGTNEGLTCCPTVAGRVFAVADATDAYTAVANGRFKGGYITRTYGKPAEDVHAIQLELTQATYMDEDHPFAFRPDRAGEVAKPIRLMIEAMLAAKPGA
ncbi:N-formylglutamate deformylase [Kordiimonas marina]|uniref:N-formylglutamate deformylase n=1 Tax=Kordiimonas marina TaxID=2872312 RepID=UPI001FF5D8A6|nr:N-formylglutamate deformylase [Kordiimonas marina]